MILKTTLCEVYEKKFTAEEEESIKKWFRENKDNTYSIYDGSDIVHACEELGIDVNKDERMCDTYIDEIIIKKGV